MNNNEIKYIGITMRNPEIRFAEHYSSGTARANLIYSTINVKGNLSRTQARILEQTLINYYGIGSKGGQLLNKINSIAPKYWDNLSITITQTY